jgi:hypothetical protein
LERLEPSGDLDHRTFQQPQTGPQAFVPEPDARISHRVVDLADAADRGRVLGQGRESAEQVAGLAAGWDDARQGSLLLDDHDVYEQSHPDGSGLGQLVSGQGAVELGEQLGQGPDGARHDWSLSFTPGRQNIRGMNEVPILANFVRPWGTGFKR